MEKFNPNPNGLSVPPYDPQAHAKMKCDTINATPGQLTGHDCPHCLNRGYMASAREDGTIAISECGCMKIRRCIWEMERSGLKNVIREKTFDTFEATEPWQQAIKSGAMAFAETGQGWLLFCGQPGSGKTHLCTAVCRQRLLAGDEVRYMPWRDSVAQLKAMSLDSDRRSELLSGFKNAGILYVDDLFKAGRSEDGSANPTAADVSLAFEIFNHRCINSLTTLVSTEKTPQELVDIDEATGSRIIEMAGANVFSIGRDMAKNYRLRGITMV